VEYLLANVAVMIRNDKPGQDYLGMQQSAKKATQTTNCDGSQVVGMLAREEECCYDIPTWIQCLSLIWDACNVAARKLA
jgi:hypothetical protein